MMDMSFTHLYRIHSQLFRGQTPPYVEESGVVLENSRLLPPQILLLKGVNP